MGSFFLLSQCWYCVDDSTTSSVCAFASASTLRFKIKGHENAQTKNRGQKVLGFGFWFFGFGFLVLGLLLVFGFVGAGVQGTRGES